MPLKDALLRYLDLALEPGAIRAVLSWPKFSITSFNLVSALARQGILPRTVIDVGANVGQFAIASAMIFPKVDVHSFEPVPEVVVKLKANVQKLPNVAVYPMALGERKGNCTFNVNSHTQSSSILALGKHHLDAFPNERETDTIEVSLNTLDAVFENVELRPPVLLKLDVQGYEAQTLIGGPRTLARCDYVLAEASFKPMYDGEASFMEIVALMARENFHFLRPVAWLTEPRTREVLQLDALFERIIALGGNRSISDSKTVQFETEA